MITEQLPAWTAPWREAGREEGLQQGLEQGLEQELTHERELILRLVTRKFDAAAAGRLSPLLDHIGEPKSLTRIADWIMDCDRPQDLLARTEALAGDS